MSRVILETWTLLFRVLCGLEKSFPVKGHILGRLIGKTDQKGQRLHARGKDGHRNALAFLISGCASSSLLMVERLPRSKVDGSSATEMEDQLHCLDSTIRGTVNQEVFPDQTVEFSLTREKSLRMKPISSREACKTATGLTPEVTSHRVRLIGAALHRHVYCFQLPKASWKWDSPSGTLGVRLFIIQGIAFVTKDPSSSLGDGHSAKDYALPDASSNEAEPSLIPVIPNLALPC